MDDKKINQHKIVRGLTDIEMGNKNIDPKLRNIKQNGFNSKNMEMTNITLYKNMLGKCIQEYMEVNDAHALGLSKINDGDDINPQLANKILNQLYAKNNEVVKTFSAFVSLPKKAIPEQYKEVHQKLLTPLKFFIKFYKGFEAITTLATPKNKKEIINLYTKKQENDLLFKNIVSNLD